MPTGINQCEGADEWEGVQIKGSLTKMPGFSPWALVPGKGLFASRCNTGRAYCSQAKTETKKQFVNFQFFVPHTFTGTVWEVNVKTAPNK